MMPKATQVVETIESEWIAFPGGELEGRRPKALCPACRKKLQRAATDGSGKISRHAPLCFECYRVGLARERALKAAGDLQTSSSVRMQFGLPFEPVNRPRLEMLKMERTAVRRALLASPSGRFADRRRRAQMAARLTLGAFDKNGVDVQARFIAAVHAAELQLPESWLPFVVGRG